MDFAIPDDERALREGLAAVLGGSRASRYGSPAPELQREVATGGWLGLALPDPEDPPPSVGFRLAYLCEEIGAQQYPAALSLPIAVVVPFLAGVPDEAIRRLSHAALHGDEFVTIVLPDAGGPFRSRFTEVVIVCEESDRAQIRGSAHGVAGADDANWILLPLERSDGTVSVAVLSADDPLVRTVDVDTLDLSRRSATIEFDGWLDKDSFIGGSSYDHRSALERLVAAYCVALDAESIGAASALLERTVAFTSNRRQFGVPVGSFQAVKHQLADCFSRIELTRSMLYRTASELEARQERSAVDIACSRMAAAAMYQFVVERCIQAHGAVGVTWEQGLQGFYRQALLYAHHPFPRSHLRDIVWRELATPMTVELHG
jgi:acyl-CoA dehydrogenase